MTERSNHTVVSTPGDHIQVLTQDRDEWKRRALAAEQDLVLLSHKLIQTEQRVNDEYWRGRNDGVSEERGTIE